MATPQYPAFDDPSGAASPPGNPPAPHNEDPPWTGWDVLAIAFLTIFSIIILLFGTAFATQHLLFRNLALVDVSKYPLVTVLAQLLAYIVVFVFMIVIVKHRPGQQFGRAIRWNWPRMWMVYILGGALLALALQAFANFLPMPKELPIDKFFQTAREAWVLSLFGVTFAPLFEELFFRGFLYPVLVRRLSVAPAVILTAGGFGLIHAPQLGHAWAPVLVVFLVGLVLTIVRATTKSVAAGFLIHVAYNGTISVLIFASTDGFRHLEKLNQ